MKAIRRINNNVAVCVDNAGNELLAMGRGIGFGQLPRELSLSEVERTFYDVDAQYLAAINDLPTDVLEVTVALVDYIRDELPYQLSPNLVITLADHLAFAIERARKNIRIAMPLSYDIEQQYPHEYRIGRHVMRRIRKEFRVQLPAEEAAGIALNLVNARLELASESEAERQRADDEMLEDITEIVEDHFGITVDRDSFAFSRYATHMHYLFGRLRAGEDLGGIDSIGFKDLDERRSETFVCVNRIISHIEDEWPGSKVSESEKLYLFLHVSRICVKNTNDAH